MTAPHRPPTMLRITRIGNSFGVILTKEVLAHMKVGIGDSVYLTESPDGWRLTPYDPAFAEQMETAREIMKRRRAVLRELAK